METAGTVYEQLGPSGKCLDKPNSRRALELCMLTFTNYGHVNNCSELLLGMTYRKFKGWLESNYHADAHITAVERAISSNWLGRLGILFQMWSKGNSEENQCALFGLKRILLGEFSAWIFREPREQSYTSSSWKPFLMHLVHPSWMKLRLASRLIPQNIASSTGKFAVD